MKHSPIQAVYREIKSVNKNMSFTEMVQARLDKNTEMYYNSMCELIESLKRRNPKKLSNQLRRLL